MTSRTSVKALASKAATQDAKLRSKGAPALGSVTADSFNNFAHKLGVGADNPLSTASYGFNPVTRNRVQLEWIYRGSWLGGIAVEAVADDCTRAGIDYVTDMAPQDTDAIDRRMTALSTWPSINEVIKWGRLYGGAIGVVLIDGQDFRTPLRLETVQKGQYRGLMALDRWMVEPSLEDLVTEMGPHIGLPKFYRITQSAPALRGIAVHHSRVAIRHVGIELPYQQRLVENLWGISILERLWDRMIAYDSASTGAAQLVYKAALRTLSIESMRDIVAAGGPALTGLMSYVEMMRRYQGIEGITLIDSKDKFEMQQTSAISGLSDALNQLGQQVSGALQIPLVRLFGQSPGGLGSNGESELRNYYDKIKQMQIKEMLSGVTLMHRLGAQSAGVVLPDNFAVSFKSLWQLTDVEKGNLAKTNTDTVSAAYGDGLISQKTALQELRQQSRTTGMFTNITRELIEAADDTTQPPPGEDELGGLLGNPALPNAPGLPPTAKGVINDGSQGPAHPVDHGASGRVPVQHAPPRRRPTSGGDSAGDGA